MAVDLLSVPCASQEGCQASDGFDAQSDPTFRAEVAAPIRRVLMTAEPFGASWDLTVELATELGRRAIDVALATMGAPLDVEQCREIARVPRLELFESELKVEWMADPWSDLEIAGGWLLDLERWLSPDVVHLSGYAHGALPWFAPVVLAGQGNVLSWWEAVHGRPAPSAWDRYHRTVARGLQGADVVVAPTRAALDELDRCYGPLAHRRVIHPGRSGELFSPGRKEPLVVAAGHDAAEAENLAAVARIAPRLAWPVALVGRGASESEAETPWTGVCRVSRATAEELASWLGRASIFAMPALYDPCGLGALEAALSGCALVLGDVPAMRELWSGAAVLVPPGDDDALAQAIAALTEDDARRSRLARAARVRAASLGPGRLCTEFLGAYREAAARRRARSGEDRDRLGGPSWRIGPGPVTMH